MKKLLSFIFTLLLLPSLSMAAIGKHSVTPGMYEFVTPAQPTSSGNKIEVIEIFYYGCPHCHRFQEHMDRWVKTIPDNVNVIRMPAVMRNDWTLLGRAFYAAEVLGVLEKSHKALFDGIHNKKDKSLHTEAGLMAFYANYGIDPELFRKTLYSFAVETKLRWAKQMVQRYQISGTPAVIINGKYRLDPGKTKGFANMINVMDHLIAKEAGK